jgi:hypothetical protein
MRRLGITAQLPIHRPIEPAIARVAPLPTWAPKGETPVVKVTAKGTVRA